MLRVLELIDLPMDLPPDLSASVLNLLWCTCSKQTTTYSCSTINAQLSLPAATISQSAFIPQCLWCTGVIRNTATIRWPQFMGTVLFGLQNQLLPSIAHLFTFIRTELSLLSCRSLI